MAGATPPNDRGRHRHGRSKGCRDPTSRRPSGPIVWRTVISTSPGIFGLDMSSGSEWSNWRRWQGQGRN